MGDEDGLGLALLSDERPPALVGRDALRWALELFEDRLGLPLPPIPRAFAYSLQVLGPSLVGTRADAPGTYDPGWFVAELAREPAPYLLFGQSGHGLNSWAVHYYLVQDSLALFLQVAWGGAYTDNATASSEVARGFAQAAELIEAPRVASLAATRRLVVVASDLVPARWGLVDRASAAEALAALPADPAPLAAAVAWAAAPAETAEETWADPRFAAGPIWG